MDSKSWCLQVQMSKLLSLKHDRVRRLADLNTEAEKAVGGARLGDVECLITTSPCVVPSCSKLDISHYLMSFRDSMQVL